MTSRYVPSQPLPHPETEGKAKTPITIPTRVGIGVYEEGILCTPELLLKAMTSCFAFILLVMVVAALAITAGGIYHVAYELNQIALGDGTVEVQFV